MIYRIKEEYIKGEGKVTYYKEFESFEECMDYCANIITLNRYVPTNFKFTLFKSKICLGSWESEGYKNVVRNNSM